jgi:hypothetical protein
MNRLAILGAAILFGASGFFVGRFSVQPKFRPADSAAVATTPPRPNEVQPISPSAPIETSSKTVSVANNLNENKWSELLSLPGSPARNSQLTAWLENLGAADPNRAMELAAAENNLKLREQLTLAALHGWARTSPSNAAQWALSLPDASKRETALSTAFAGMIATDPEIALRMGNQIVAQNPNDAIGYGSRLIDALVDDGDFQKAAQWASSGDAQTQSPWMAEAYSRWAEFQPQQAAQAAAGISDPAERNLALHGIVGGWAQADPAGLVQFVTDLPANTDRASLLSQSLERWAREDPASAAQWISSSKASPALDQGIAVVATLESVPPNVAMTWAEGIANPQLRSETVASVLRNWLTTDQSTAENYFAATKNLLPEDRQQIAEVIAAKSGLALSP